MRRGDHLALGGGIAFIALFLLATWLFAPTLSDIARLPDQGASWYYWKLAEPTWVTRLSAWGCYLAHQLASFAIIAWAQRSKAQWQTNLHRFNIVALAVNAGFVALRLVQTHLTYDGLAQDVSIWSALGSVAVLLIWVLLLENPRRGLFFGAKVPFSQDLQQLARKTHGYFFSWAIVYTFWYHPTEATSGHLVGFGYLLLILLQGSLFFTRVHTNRWWTLALEVLVVAHGTAVAVMQGEGLWPMFFFGFTGVFVVTQVFGIARSRAIRLGALLLWCAGVAFVYRDAGLARLSEPLRIPLIDYLGVLALAGLLWLAARVRNWVTRTAPTPHDQGVS